MLMLKPDSDAVKMAAFRNKNQSVDTTNLIVRKNLLDLSMIGGIADLKGQLEVRVVDYLPPWTLVAIDPHLPTGRIFVRLCSFRTPNELRPTFVLDAKHDKEWATFFVEQFEAVWQVAEPVALDGLKNTN